MRPMFSVSNLWQRRAVELLDHKSPPVIMICGTKNVGKSSFARYLSNSFLSRKYADSGVAYLDLDPGQPEYTAPADLSLIHVKDFNLGPSFTHPMSLEDHNDQLIRQHHFGYYSPREDLEYYLDCISDLFRHYGQRMQQLGCPLIINTSGWTQGFGLESIVSLVKRILPTHMAYLASSEADDEIRTILRQSISKLDVKLAILPVENRSPSSRSAADLRSMQFSSYFHLDKPEYGQCRWNSDLLVNSGTIPLSYDGKDAIVSGVLLLGDQINYDMLEAAIDKTVVALIVVEQSSALHKILHKPQGNISQHVDSNSIEAQDDSLEEFTVYDISADEQMSRETRGYMLSHNKQGIPYLASNDAVNPPPDPTTTWSMGQVLLSKIDTKQKNFHVHTSIPLHTMRSCLDQGMSLILVRGQLGMPEWAYLEEYCLSKAIQEDATELYELEEVDVVNATFDFDIKSWAQGVDYVEYQDNRNIGGMNKVRRTRRNL